MTEIKPFTLQDTDGTTYEVLIESTTAPVPSVSSTPNHTPTTQRDGSPSDYKDDGIRGGQDPKARAHLQQVHGTIRAYSNYVIGAFKNMAGANVQELTLKFGLKIGGEAGLPIFTKGSVESNFEVEVKCTFPPTETQQW